MSKYVMTQQQLDDLQDQVQHLKRQNDAQQKRIKELELHRARVLNNETADLIITIERLENEVENLKKANESLTDEVRSNKANLTRFEKILDEERTHRKYSSTTSRESDFQHSCQSIKQLKLITEQLKLELYDLHKSLEKGSIKTNEDRQNLNEIEKWLRKIKLIITDINNIEILNQELLCMRQEIEKRRKLSLKSQN